MFRPITVNGRLLDLPADYATRDGLLGKVPVTIVNVYNAVLSTADNVLEDFFDLWITMRRAETNWAKIKYFIRI